MSNAEARIAELELKLALTEDHLDTLNRTLFRQQQQMDLLQEQLRASRQHPASRAPQLGVAFEGRQRQKYE